jgi:hypothetical protein
MLKKIFSLVLLMSLMGTVVSLGAQELAQSPASPLTAVGNDSESQGGINVSTGGAHTLYATYAKYSNTPVIVGAGFQPVDDGTTFTCPGPGGSCLVEFDQYVQIGDSATGNRWAICSELDGVSVSTPGCAYQGYTHIAGQYLYQVGSFVQFAVNVPPGTHTLQTFVYSDHGLTKGLWSLIYRVYKP